MAKEFNFMKRSGELLEQGYSIEEAIDIMGKESAESDYTVLDDGAWFDLLAEIAEGAEERYQASLKDEE